jgi:uncharacterized protein (DUF1015 family)
MNIKPFKAGLPKIDQLFSISLFFENVKNDYVKYRDRGFYSFTDKEELFIYEYKDAERSYTGLICSTDVNDYLDGTILKHEDTLTEKEEKQIALAIERQATIKPILLMYKPLDDVQQLLSDYKSENQPIYSIKFKEGRHTVWSISGANTIEKLVHHFQHKVTKAYIADGHHRSATNARLYLDSNKDEKYRYLHTIYLADVEMKVSNWNRLITNIEKYSPIEFMAILSHYFDITPIAEPFQPKEPHILVMYLEKKWFQMVWKQSILDKYQDLPLEQRFDISMFNVEIANNVLEIEDVKTDLRLDYMDSIKGFEGIAKAVEKGNSLSMGFIFSPLALHDLFEVADQNQIMPPKSTFMMPRIYNGMVIAPFE